MVGCLRRLRRMLEVEGRGTKNTIVSPAKHISIDSNYIREKGSDKQSSSGEDRVISAPRRGQGHGKQRMAERAISSEQGENVRQHFSSTMIKVRYIYLSIIVSPSLVFGVPDCCPDAAAFLAAASLWKGRRESPFRISGMHWSGWGLKTA